MCGEEELRAVCMYVCMYVQFVDTISLKSLLLAGSGQPEQPHRDHDQQCAPAGHERERHGEQAQEVREAVPGRHQEPHGHGGRSRQ